MLSDVRALAVVAALAWLVPHAAAQAQAEPRVAVLASLDVGFAIDGVSPNGQPGAHARIGVDLGAVELAIEAHGGGPDTVESERVAFHVARGAIRAQALLELIDDGEWRLPLGLALGLSGWARLSTPHDLGLEASGGATSGGFTAGILGRVQWLPAFFGRIVGLELGLGVDLVVPSPRFVIEEGERVSVVAATWPLSPHASFGIVVRATP